MAAQTSASSSSHGAVSPSERALRTAPRPTRTATMAGMHIKHRPAHLRSPAALSFEQTPQVMHAGFLRRLRPRAVPNRDPDEVAECGEAPTGSGDEPGIVKLAAVADVCSDH